VCASFAPVGASAERFLAVVSGKANRCPERPKPAQWSGFRLNGAAQESNLPSRGLHDRTGFEDRLGHRAHAAPARA
jgi:hypothetical protein